MNKSGLEINKPTITYCQLGVRAAHVAFMLEYINDQEIELPKVYDESMARWANDHSLPYD
jgi:thiosulfate/3-mercaptopyruvate sulfurtransferase